MRNFNTSFEHARGTAGKDSYIDIAVVVEELPDDYLEIIILRVRVGVMDEENGVFPLRYMSKNKRKGLSFEFSVEKKVKILHFFLGKRAF